MIIVELMGGLGNQMFQYAAGIAVTEHLNMQASENLKIDISFLGIKSRNKFHIQRKFGLDLFQISGSIASNLDILRFTLPHFQNRMIYHGLKLIFPQRNVFQESACSLSEIPTNAYLSGYWQDATILEPIDKIIKQEFKFKDGVVSSKNLQTGKIIRETQFSTCISFRRGDYVAHRDLGFLTMNYYEKALSTLTQIIGHNNINIFVFSDDINWCKQNFRATIENVIYIDDKYSDGTMAGDLYLMQQCKFFIIPNSTFHFWGGYLAENNDKIVIVPEKYSLSQTEKRSKIWPNGWIAIDCI